MTFTKAHIVEDFFAKGLFTKGESAQIIETLLELIKQSLERGDDFLIRGFGKFSVREKHQRMGRSPLTGEPMALPPRTVVTFHYSGILKEKINGGGRA
jgi:integration host factor subunit alpha